MGLPRNRYKLSKEIIQVFASTRVDDGKSIVSPLSFLVKKLVQSKQSSSASPRKGNVALPSSDPVPLPNKQPVVIDNVDIFKRKPCVLLTRNIENEIQINSLLGSLANCDSHHTPILDIQTDAMPECKNLSMKRPLSPQIVSESNKKIKLDSFSLLASCSSPPQPTNIVNLPNLLTDPDANLSSDVVAAFLPESPMVKQPHLRKPIKHQLLPTLYVVVQRMPSDILESSQWTDTLSTAKSVCINKDGHTLLLRKRKLNSFQTDNIIDQKLGDDAGNKKNQLEKPKATSIQITASSGCKKGLDILETAEKQGVLVVDSVGYLKEHSDAKVCKELQPVDNINQKVGDTGKQICKSSTKHTGKRLKGIRTLCKRNSDDPNVTDITVTSIQELKNVGTTKLPIQGHKVDEVLSPMIAHVNPSSDTTVGLNNNDKTKLGMEHNDYNHNSTQATGKMLKALAKNKPDPTVFSSTDQDLKTTDTSATQQQHSIAIGNQQSCVTPPTNISRPTTTTTTATTTSKKTQPITNMYISISSSHATNDMTLSIPKDNGQGQFNSNTIAGRNEHESGKSTFKIPFKKPLAKQDKMSSLPTTKNTLTSKSITKKLNVSSNKGLYSQEHDGQRNKNALPTQSSTRYASASRLVEDNQMESSNEPSNQKKTFTKSRPTLPLCCNSTTSKTKLTESSNQQFSKECRHANSGECYSENDSSEQHVPITAAIKELIKIKQISNEKRIMSAQNTPYEDSDYFDEDAISLHPDYDMFEETSPVNTPNYTTEELLVPTNISPPHQSNGVAIAADESASGNNGVVPRNKNNEEVMEYNSSLENQTRSSTINQYNVRNIAPPAVRDQLVLKINHMPPAISRNWLVTDPPQQFLTRGYWDNVLINYCVDHLKHGICQSNTGVCRLIHKVPEVSLHMNCDEIQSFLLFSKQRNFNHAVHCVLITLCNALYLKTHLADPALWKMLQDELVSQIDHLDWFVHFTLQRCNAGYIDKQFLDLVTDLLCDNDVSNQRWEQLLSIQTYELSMNMIEKLMAKCITSTHNLELVKIIIYQGFVKMPICNLSKINSALFVKFQNKVKHLGLTKYYEYLTSLLKKKNDVHSGVHINSFQEQDTDSTCPPECVAEQSEGMVSTGGIQNHMPVDSVQLVTRKVGNAASIYTISVMRNTIPNSNCINQCSAQVMENDAAVSIQGDQFRDLLLAELPITQVAFTATSTGDIYNNRMPNSANVNPSSSVVIEKDVMLTHSISSDSQSHISLPHGELAQQTVYPSSRSVHLPPHAIHGGHIQPVYASTNTESFCSNTILNPMYIDPSSSVDIEKHAVPSQGIAGDSQTYTQVGNTQASNTAHRRNGFNNRIADSAYMPVMENDLVTTNNIQSLTQGRELIMAGGLPYNNEILGAQNPSHIKPPSTPDLQINAVPTQAIQAVDLIRINYEDASFCSSNRSNQSVEHNTHSPNAHIATPSAYGASTACSRPLDANEWEYPSIGPNMQRNENEYLYAPPSACNLAPVTSPTTERKPFAFVANNMWSDKEFLNNALVNDDYDGIYTILNRWCDSLSVALLTEVVVKYWTTKRLHGCDVAFRQLVHIAVQRPVNVGESGHKMKDVLSTIGINLIIDAIKDDDDDRMWAVAHNILQHMICNNIRPFTLKATDGLSPSRQILMCSEICMNHDQMETAVDLLEGNALFSPDPKQWTGESTYEDINTRIQFCEALLESITSEAKYLSLAFRLFTGINNAQHNVPRNMQIHLVDLQKSINELLLSLANQHEYDRCINIFKYADVKRLKLHIIRALVVIHVQRDRYSTARHLYNSALTQCHYPEVKIQMPLTITMKTYWLQEEMFVILNEFFTNVANNIKSFEITDPRPLNVTITLEAEQLTSNSKLEIVPNIIIDVDGNEIAAKNRLKHALKMISVKLILETNTPIIRVTGFSVMDYINQVRHQKIPQ